MRNFEIQSHSGAYSVFFDNDLISNGTLKTLGTHYVIDKNVFATLPAELTEFLKDKNVVIIEATEEAKDFLNIAGVIETLIGQGLKRDSKLVVIGGGIIQDICCFIATLYMRGISWTFVPTTLLAQADSCIGSKSSINFKKYKNLLGSFTPPNQVYICDKFLRTLEDKDFTSGLGEIAKLFIIGGKDFDPITIDLNNVSDFIYAALMIKKDFIEQDEFDKGIRNILNYGHCVGHGIESATNFAIPHGIAVSMGMAVVNKFAEHRGLISSDYAKSQQAKLYPLYESFTNIEINTADVFSAQTKDKKNTGNMINLILPVDGKIKKQGFENEPLLWNDLKQSFVELDFIVG